jgi:hypothetical protein
VLAVTPPGRHETPLWPFSFRLAPDVTWNVPGVKMQVLIGSQVVLVGLLALVAGCLMRRGRSLWLAGAAVLLVAGAQQALPPLAVDAYPTNLPAPRRFPTPRAPSRTARSSTGRSARPVTEWEAPAMAPPVPA